MKGAKEEVLLALWLQRCIPQHKLLFTQRCAFFSHAAHRRQREAAPSVALPTHHA